MTRMKGADAFLACLKREGVKYIFGNPGSTEAPILDALVRDRDVTYLITLHESVAVGMADGYARGGETLGVVNVHTGAGTANALGAIYNASIEKSPILVAAGSKDTRLLGRNCFSEVTDMPGMARQFTKWSRQVTCADRVPEELSRGIKIATTEPQGPVYLSFPEDLLAEEIDAGAAMSLRLANPLIPQPDEDMVKKAARLLMDAKAPLMIAGTEVARSNALGDAVRLAELLGLPVMTEGRESLATLNFPHSHPSFRGMFDPDSPLVKNADVILGIGCKLFVETAYSSTPDIPPGAAILHFHPDPHELAKIYPEAVSVLGDAGKSITALIAACAPLLTEALRKTIRERIGRLKTDKEALDAALTKATEDAWDKTPISLARLFGEMNRCLARDAIIADEAIRSSRALYRFYHFDIPGTYQRSTAGVLGWGLPAAMGLKLANPGRQVVAVVGDGGFLFTVQGLWTAARYAIPVVVVICNNRQYRAVRDACIRYDGIAARCGSFVGTDMNDPEVEFTQLAAGFGVWAKKITAPEAIGPALSEALSLGKPAVLDVRIA